MRSLIYRNTDKNFINLRKICRIISPNRRQNPSQTLNHKGPAIKQPHISIYVNVCSLRIASEIKPTFTFKKTYKKSRYAFLVGLFNLISPYITQLCNGSTYLCCSIYRKIQTSYSSYLIRQTFSPY